MNKHLLTPANAKIMDATIDQIATAANGTPFPGGFLTSARKADPSGAAAAHAARSAAGLESQHNVAIEAVKAGAPAVSGGKSSPSDAIIFKLGRSAVAKAGTTGWPAYQQAALESRKKGGEKGRKKGGKKGGQQSQRNTAAKAVTAGASTASEGGSKKSAMVYLLSGSDKSPATTWTEREDLAWTIRKKGGDSRAADTRIEAMALPIATHSHECIELQCRRPVEICSKFVKGKMYTTFSHRCPVNKGKIVDGFGKHMCSTCHQTGRVCKDAICRYSKCSTSTSACAHLHDGSGIPRK